MPELDKLQLNRPLSAAKDPDTNPNAPAVEVVSPKEDKVEYKVLDDRAFTRHGDEGKEKRYFNSDIEVSDKGTVMITPSEAIRFQDAGVPLARVEK